MGKLGGFLQIERHGVPYRDPAERAHDYKEFLITRPEGELRDQGARCMDCGVPFCHNGCPLGNLIPDWNDLVYRDRWQDAIAQLHATNNFPEFTGRLCPAPCEAACVLEIREGDAVTIKQIENSIINRAWEEGWVRPMPPRKRDRPGGSGRRLGAGGDGRGAAASPRRASRDAVRARRGDRRPRALRRARLQDREDRRAAPRRAARGRGRGAALRRGRGPRRDRGGAARRLRRGRARDRLARAARSAGAGTRARRACTSRWTTSTSATAGRRASSGPSRPPRSRRRPARSSRQGPRRRRDRRRRHGRGLRRQRAARGCALDHPAGAPAGAAAEAARRAHPVAGVAAEVPHELRDGGGQGCAARRAGLLDRDDALLRRRPGWRGRAARRAGRAGASIRAARGHRAGDEGAARAAGDGLPAPRAGAARRGSAWRRTRAATSRRRRRTRALWRACSLPAMLVAGSR